MSRILCLCDQGVNRSVTVAHQVKYLGHDVLSAGTKTNSLSTLRMLSGWADHIITTEPSHSEAIPTEHLSKVQCWDVGPDRFPRPFNRELLGVVRGFVEQNRGRL